MGQEREIFPPSYENLVARFNQLDSHGRYEEARQACYRMEEVTTEKKGEIAYRIGLTWWREGKIALAESRFDEAVDSLAPDDPMLIRVYNELSLLEQSRGAWIGPYGSLIGWIGLLEKRNRFGENRHLRKALEYSEKSLDVWKRLDPKFQKSPQGQKFWIHTLDVQGLSYTAAGMCGIAITNHELIINEASKTGNKPALICARNNLGVAYYFGIKTGSIGSFPLAEKYFRQRLEEDEDKTSVGHAIVLSNLARVLEAQGKKEEAAGAYGECLFIARKTGQKVLIEDGEERIVICMR